MSEMTRITAAAMNNAGWTRGSIMDFCYDDEGNPSSFERAVWTKEGQQQLLSYGFSEDFLVDKVQMDHLLSEGVVLPPYVVE